MNSPNGSSQKLYVVIGTRAQMIKMAPLMVLMQKENIEYEFVYTAQHRETIQRVIKDFGVKQPDRVLYSRGEANTIYKFMGWWGSMFLKIFIPRKVFPIKGLILTHGDTATCSWTAFVGKLAGCRVAHVESGLRSFNILAPFPEELMRLISFRFSDIYFCPNKWAMNNLKKYKGEKVNLGINPLYDSIMAVVKSKKTIHTDKPKGKYIVVSIHRYENIFKSRFENTIIPLLEEIALQGLTLVFVLHPTTREVLKKKKGRLYKRLQDNPKILLKKRYPFFEFITLLSQSEFVITDGGSNQEELSYLGVPTLLFRELTERIEGLGKNVIISQFDRKKIFHFINNYKLYKRPLKKQLISPAKKIVYWLKKNKYGT